MTLNKIKNQNLLCETNVFSYVMNYFNATTDNTFTYIPLSNTTDYIKYNEDKIPYGYAFDNRKPENGYADLGIGYLHDNEMSTNKFVKVIHINTLHKFSIDSNIFTFQEDLKNLTYMIYSDFEFLNAEKGKQKFILMPASTLMTFFENLNMKLNTPIIDLINMEDKLKLIGDYSIINYDGQYFDSLDEGTKININCKSNHCWETLNSTWYNAFHLKNLPLGNAYHCTHNGHQYALTNLKNGRSFNFRDAHALHNFCIKYGILENINYQKISRRCNNQDKILNGDTPNKYSCNLYQDKDGTYWFISIRAKFSKGKSMLSETQILENIKLILTVMRINSKKWNSKYGSFTRVILAKIDKIIKKIKKSFGNILKKVYDILIQDFEESFVKFNLKYSKLLI